MASRFVSGGTVSDDGHDEAKSQAEPFSQSGPPPPLAATSGKQAEWAAVQADLEQQRQQRQEAKRREAEGGERSLYEVLQANRAAKQAAFEEASRLSNQFRALDDDEIDFLDSVRASAKAAEDHVRKQTEEGLEEFRARQRMVERDLGNAEDTGESENGEGPTWNATKGSRKRKRDRLKSSGKEKLAHGTGKAKSLATREKEEEEEEEDEKEANDEERDEIEDENRMKESGEHKKRVREDGTRPTQAPKGTFHAKSNARVGSSRPALASEKLGHSTSSAAPSSTAKTGLVSYDSDDDDDDN